MPLSTEPKIRYRGLLTNTYTRTIENQVGPDTLSLSIRTLPTFGPTTTKYVDKTGNDGAATGATGDPYLTIQHAIDNLSGAFVYVVVQDSGVYQERIDLDGFPVYAADGETPTIKYLDSGLEVLHDFGQKVYDLLEWEISNVLYIYAATDSGIWRSSDGGHTFASWALSGKACNGFCVFANELYVANDSDKDINKITTAAASSVFKDWSGFYSTLKDIKLVNGVLVSSGDVFASGSRAVLNYEKSGTWYSIGTEHSTGETGGKLYYNADFSETIGFASGDINTTSQESATIISDGIDVTFGEVIYTGTQVTNKPFFAKGSALYLLTAARLFIYNNYIDSPTVFSTIRKEDQDNWVDDAGIFYIDEKETWYLGEATSGGNLIRSFDSGATWEIISGTKIHFACVIEHGEGLVFGDIETGGDSTVYYNQTMISSGSAGTGEVNGFILDGNSAGYYGLNGFLFGMIAKHCQFTELVTPVKNSKGINTMDCQNNIFNGNINGIKCTAGGVVDKYNLFRGNTGQARFYKNITINSDHVTATGNGFGLVVDGVNTITALTNQIIFDNTTRDINAITALSDPNFDYILYRSGTGSITVFSVSFTENPLFVDALNNDYNLKDIASGYLWNSKYIQGEVGQSLDSEDLGCYEISRSISGSSYSLDYVVSFNPTTKSTEYRPSNYKTFENQQGVSSEFFTGVKALIKLGWGSDTLGKEWIQQAFELYNLYKQENVIIEYGLTTDGGTTWEPFREGTGNGDVVALDKTLEIPITAYATERWPTDFFSGFWVLIDSQYYRITGHAPKAKSGTVLLNLYDPDGDLSDDAAADWSIDFMKVKVISRNAFTMNVPLFESRKEMSASDDALVPGSGQPIFNYALELREAE